VAALEKEFLESCRADLLARCWRRLAALEAETRRPWYSVLRLRAERPAMRSAELATVLGARLGTSLTSGGVRVMLHRARERFADILLDEVAHSIDNASQARLEQELIDLRLLEYCRPALERRRAG
jgi:RNA polymerase sigma-70 factor (ECF subfamily)